MALDGHVSRTTGTNQPPVNDYSAYTLSAQYGQTVKAIMKLTALSVEEVRPRVFVYDTGQNMVGVPEILLTGMEPGKRINVRYAEVKYPDLPRYTGNQGMIMLENIRAAMAQDVYITKGGKEMMSPRFTYHGYRYLEITGIDEALPVEDVRGIVLSSVDGLASYYESSNEKVNKLWHNIVWSTYANFFSIPTDCPQRNERLGWDLSLFSDCYLFSRCLAVPSSLSACNARCPAERWPFPGCRSFRRGLWGLVVGECWHYDSLGAISAIW